MGRNSIATEVEARSADLAHAKEPHGQAIIEGPGR
jgi:hypothetical protein